MFVARLLSGLHTVVLLAIFALWMPSGWAQQPLPTTPGPQPQTGLPAAPTNQAVLQNYSKPKPAISLIGLFPPRSVPPANLENAPQLQSLMKNGAIYLSLSDAHRHCAGR